VIRALLILLLLSGCASKPHSYTYDKGLVYDGRQYWIGEVSEEYKINWQRDHLLTPVFDDKERESLAWCAWGSAADLATTAYGLLSCSALREVNPIFAWMSPTGIVATNAALSYGLCRYWRKQAEMSPLADSRWQAPRQFGRLRTAVAVWNVGQIARCM